MKKETNNKSNSILAVALASVIAFSAMAASVMAGCTDNPTSNSSETEVVHETQIATKYITETKVIDIDPTGNDDNSSSSQGNDKSNDKTDNSSNNSSSNSQSSAASNGGNKTSSSSASSSSKPSGSSSNKTSSGTSDNKNESSDIRDPSATVPVDKTKVCTIDGNKFHVGEQITCVYKLKAPTVLENFQAVINYNSKHLRVDSAKLTGDAKAGSLLNKNIAGKINFNGVNISSGYDYTQSGDFLIIKYTVLQEGTTNTNVSWTAACEFGAEPIHNYIGNNGKPEKGFKFTAVYSKD